MQKLAVFQTFNFVPFTLWDDACLPGTKIQRGRSAIIADAYLSRCDKKYLIPVGMHFAIMR